MNTQTAGVDVDADAAAALALAASIHDNGEADGGNSSRPSSGVSSQRTSMYTYYTIAAQHDTDVHDALAQAQAELQGLKDSISRESKTNFVLERDVRYLDSRIALLIANRMGNEERADVAGTLEDAGAPRSGVLGDLRMQQYSSFFYLLQTEPRHIASLCRLVSLAEIDSLLQTVMFTLYGNQYESREEHLLLTMFQSVLSAQFECATDYGSLLRTNTPVSRMMSTYTRRGPGQSYLKRVLSPRINEVVAMHDTDLETNPQRIYEQLCAEGRCERANLPPEEVTALPEVQVVLRPRAEALCRIAGGFLDTVVGSLPLIPYGIRWICKQIRGLTRRKYPQLPDAALCSLIGAFFFLRFVNPAVVTPQACMLVDEAPSLNPRRTLTLVAKMLQTLVNKPAVYKEPFMQCVEPFFTENKPRVHAFLYTVCNVGDFYDTMELDQYIGLSKRDLSISITLNEMYHMHALVEEYLDVLAPAEDHNLRKLMHELGPAPAQVPRRRNYTLELPLFSRWETQIQDLTSTLMTENNMTQNDILYMETKSLFVQLIRSLPPPLVRERPIQLQHVLDAVAHARDPILVHKGIKAHEMLRELEELRVLHAHDQHRLMTDEIAAELEFLGNAHDEVLSELASLRSVLSTISEHNVYLRSQLDTYKSYLQNVRVLSGANAGGKASAKSNVRNTGAVHRFTHQQLERDGVIEASEIPEDRQARVFFQFSSPLPGTFLITLHYKGRTTPILEMDLKLDDLLEKQREGVRRLSFEYVQIRVDKLQALLNRLFAKPRRR